jgi:hypothetical protein
VKGDAGRLTGFDQLALDVLAPAEIFGAEGVPGALDAASTVAA